MADKKITGLDAINTAADTDLIELVSNPSGPAINKKITAADFKKDKAPIASPTFTGTVSGITAAMVGAPAGSGTSTGSNTGDQALPIGGTPALTLGVANAAGSAATFVKTDATILAFDVTDPSTQAFGDAADDGAATTAARRDHKHAMMAAPTSVSGNAGTVTGLSLNSNTLALTTGDLSLVANADNTSALTIGAGAVAVSGTNTGDDAVNSNYSGLTQYTDELAQDAVGGMVDTTLTYTDGTPELKVTNPVVPQTVGFTIAAGTTPKTLTVALDASVSGTNTGDQTSVSGNAGTVTGLTLNSNLLSLTTGDLQLVANVADSSVLTVGAGAVSVSGANTGDQDLSGLVTKATYDAQTILHATADNTPVALTVGEQTVVGRATGGNIVALAIDSDLSTTSAAHDTLPSALAVKTVTDGKMPNHGIDVAGALSFDNSTHILTIAAGTNTYWYLGTKYTTASAITCDLDGFITLTANTLYFVYFNDATGTLKAGTTSWNLYTVVPVATVFWNGSAGAVITEKHGHRRDPAWHTNAHLTIGTRYYSGLAQTAPTTAADATLTIGSGTLYDEDLALTIAAQSTMRGLYQTSAGVYTFADYALPYLGTSGQPQYLDTDTYALTNVGANDYACMWVYGCGDIARPIYIIPTHAAAVYNTLALARLEAVPTLSALNISPEMKLLYRWIYKGDGNYQEGVDYRNASSLPAGGSSAVNATSVSFAPAGNIVATNVQSAIEELDTEKAAIAQTMYIGTTATAINRASAAQTLAGLTLTTPDIGTPSAGTLTSCSGLPIAGLASSTSTAIGVGSIELGHASDTTITRVSAGLVAIEGVNVVTTSSTATLTNKTLTAPVMSGVFDKKEVAVSDGAGAVIDTSLGNVFTWVAAADRTAGTPTNPPAAGYARFIVIEFTASGAARTLTLPTATTNDFRFGSDITALTQTASGKKDRIGCKYDHVASRWDVIAYVKGY